MVPLSCLRMIYPPLLCLFQLKKIQEKLKKCQADVEATRDKYEASLNDLNSYNAKYIEDMNEVYQIYLLSSQMLQPVHDLKFEICSVICSQSRNNNSKF